MDNTEILEKAARQYQHNNCSGFVHGFDYDETVKIVLSLQKAYWLARNSAAGLTNYCEDSASVRKCEKELQEAEDIYRAI